MTLGINLTFVGETLSLDLCQKELKTLDPDPSPAMLNKLILSLDDSRCVLAFRIENEELPGSCENAS